MIARTSTTALMLGLLAGVLTACDTAPEAPEPTPLFATEEQAFEAAEATYRAYVDALNNVDLSDPATFEELYAWTTGDLNAQDRKSFSEWHARAFAMSGTARVAVVRGLSMTSDGSEVSLVVCYDVSDVAVIDDQGNSLVSVDREDVQPLTVRLDVSDSTPTSLALSSIEPGEDAIRC
ncbi:hypothetical protein P0L94_05985 [Microbacter sp. GSS18]|nr:hypothetical protein P0L94_05985 [Microbacter sp. GSS18]